MLGLLPEAWAIDPSSQNAHQVVGGASPRRRQISSIYALAITFAASLEPPPLHRATRVAVETRRRCQKSRRCRNSRTRAVARAAHRSGSPAADPSLPRPTTRQCPPTGPPTAPKSKGPTSHARPTASLTREDAPTPARRAGSRRRAVRWQEKPRRLLAKVPAARSARRASVSVMARANRTRR